MSLHEGLPRCRHTHIVREWAIEGHEPAPGKLPIEALQHCEWCGAARVLRAGKWSRWRVLPISAVPHGPGVVVRGAMRGLVG
jgi:hypothetical protein